IHVSSAKQHEKGFMRTPMRDNSILHGKLCGVMASIFWYLLAYGATAVLFAALGGVLALFWPVIWLAATVLAMYYIGAAGLYCSARSKNSWRSLLGTVVYGYLGGLGIFLVASPVSAILALILILLLAIMDIFLKTGVASLAFQSFPVFRQIFLVSSSVSLVVMCWVTA